MRPKRVNDFFFKQVLFVVSMKERTLETELVLLNKLLSVPYKEKKKKEKGGGQVWVDHYHQYKTAEY